MLRRKIILTCIVAALIVLLAMLYCFPPEQYAYWPKCLLLQFTGLHCPACGGTRAVAALLHGDLHRSLANNILLIPSALACLVLGRYPALLKRRSVTWSLVGVIALFFVLRNLPWQPFCLLAPH